MTKTQTGTVVAEREESLAESGGEMLGRLGAGFVLGVVEGGAVLWRGTLAFGRGVKRGVAGVRPAAGSYGEAALPDPGPSVHG